MKEYPDFVKFHLPALAWMVFIFTLSSIPGSALAPIEFPYAHLIAHSLLYTMLYYLFYRAFGHQQFSIVLRKFRVGTALFCVAIWGASDEYHQSFTPGRSPEIKDFLIDISAGLVVMIAVLLISRKSHDEKQISESI